MESEDIFVAFQVVSSLAKTIIEVSEAIKTKDHAALRALIDRHNALQVELKEQMEDIAEKIKAEDNNGN